MVALAEKAADAEYNEVRQQVKVAIADGSWLGDAAFNDMAYRNVMGDTGTQPQQLYYTDLHYGKPQSAALTGRDYPTAQGFQKSCSRR